MKFFSLSLSTISKSADDGKFFFSSLFDFFFVDLLNLCCLTMNFEAVVLTTFVNYENFLLIGVLFAGLFDELALEMFEEWFCVDFENVS